MLILLLLGSLVGGTLGIMGAGGSTLAIPLLAYGVGLEPREAIATSLIVVALAATAGAARHWRQGTIDFRVAATFGLFGFLGSAVGAQAARFLSPKLQMTLFASTLILTATFMLAGKHPPEPNESRGSGATPPATALAALGAGLLTGVVGVGGGFVVVPALVILGRLPMHRAVGTSLVVIVLNALGGIASYASYVTLAPSILVPFALAAMIAAVAGAMVAHRIGELRLRSAFAIVLIVLGVFTIARESFL